MRFRNLEAVNWQVRSILILASAVGLYLAMAWVLAGEGDSKSVLAVERRMEALEKSQSAGHGDSQTNQDQQGRGTLFRLLVRNPGLGETLLAGWDSQRLTGELGWPDQVEGQIWTYSPRLSSGESLRVIVNATGFVGGVEVLPHGTKTE